MASRMRRGAIPLALGAAAFVVALLQRPGLASSDTKIDLHVDPLRFLGEVASTWSDSFGLGAVWGGQYGGYLWPMGPVFAAGHGVGLPPWLVHRLWLGLVLALTAWGMVLLVDALVSGRRGAPHIVAGVLVLANPFVVTFANRTSVTLLALAALPWLLLATHRALAAPRGWWWPAVFALVLTSAGGGVNAATTAWVLLGPLVLIVYEAGVLGIAWRSVVSFGLRLVPLVAVTSAWWVIPALVQAAYGVDFLPYVEQPETIWHTTSVTESLRGLGFWLSYAGIGSTGSLVPFFSDAGTFLFAPLVVVASLLVPVACLLGFAAARRAPYAPFALILVLVGLLAMMAGFPEGSPMRGLLTGIYEQVAPLRFLRTTYKAGPLLVVGLALLAALGVAELRAGAGGSVARRIGRRVPALNGRRLAGAAWALGALVVALSAWPMARGVVVDRQVGFEVPADWERAADDVRGDAANDTRGLVLPGALFGFYDWGGTTDPILRSLADVPVAQRFIVPYSDLRATELLWAIDALVEDQRTFDGQLGPLLDLISAGSILVPADRDRIRAGTVPPADAAGELEAGGLTDPDATYGPSRTRQAAAPSLAPDRALPRLRRFVNRDARPLVRLEPRRGGAIVDGSGAGLVDLAAFGSLPGGALHYAADWTPEQIRAAARAGAEVVLTDSNRRQVFTSSRIRANAGWTLDAEAELPPQVATLDPFANAGTEAQTVARYGGIRSLSTPLAASGTLFAERGPFAAIDGRPETAWLPTTRFGDPIAWEVGFERPTDVPEIELLPYGDARGRPVEVEIDGRRHTVKPGWNRLRLGLRDARSLRVEITTSAAPAQGGSPGGLAEVRIPGIRASQALRLPTVAAQALGPRLGADVPLSVVLRRATAYAPWRSTGSPAGALQEGDLRDRADPEQAMERIVELPAARRFEAIDARLSPGPQTPDPVLDRLAGTDAPARFDSSSRYESVPARRASAAFDGDRSRGWVGEFVPGVRDAWVQWTTAEPQSVAGLTLAKPRTEVRVPTRVRLDVDGTEGRPVTVGPGGRVRLPTAARGRRFRLQILDARFRDGAPGRVRQRRAVGIGEIAGPGVPRGRAPRPGAPIESRCGDATVNAGDATVRMRATGSVAELEAGRALEARACDELRLGAGRTSVKTAPGPLRVDTMRLRSGIRARAAVTASPGRVLDAGSGGDGSREGVRLQVDDPAWLVLGQSYSRGWRATCDGRDLGEPVPIDGYANGWKVDRCAEASFRFGPDRAATAGYVVSGLGALALLVFLVVRPAGDRPRPLRALPRTANGMRRWPWWQGLAAGLLASPVLGLLFSLRAGAVLGPLVALVLWRGIGPRALTYAAAAVLGVAVPAVYLLFGPADNGGYNANYATELLGAHWLGVVALTLLGLACAATVIAHRALRRGGAGPQ
ncbi:MAG: alpha-(1-_3)-arabinofuranosyltransferase domain-containing protein [Solirubrobacterales bacterium]